MNQQQMSGRQAAKNLPFEFWYALPARTDQIREQAEAQLPPAEIPAFRGEIQRRAILAIIGLVIFLAIWCAVFSDVMFGASLPKRHPQQQQQLPASTNSEPDLKTIPF